MSTKLFVKLHQATFFNRAALHQIGELDQPDVHPIVPILFPRSPAFRQGTFCQIRLSGVGVTYGQQQNGKLA